jgi:hypothetical protein
MGLRDVAKECHRGGHLTAQLMAVAREMRDLLDHEEGEAELPLERDGRGFREVRLQIGARDDEGSGERIGVE